MEANFIPYQATISLPDGNILILAPHPDDEVFGCGGAIMQHIAQQHRVHVIIVTDGNAASTHNDANQLSKYIILRQQESLNAATILGYGKPIFWKFADRNLSINDELLIQKITNYILKHKITQIYAPSITEIHPDHYALAINAIEAINRCKQPLQLTMYEVGMPLNPNLLLDISPYFERKKAAMACFSSQLKLQNYDKHIQSLNVYRAYTLSKQIIAAEAYYVLNNEDLQQNSWQLFGQSRQKMALKQTHQKIKQLEIELQTKNTELTGIYHSHSWFLTRPLRWFNSFF
ncbi:MAG: PIG-L family deacetylase [Thiomargarita sp.]|nr:PIG-L family deacetylase [Thiomargarita sp.]